MTAPLRSLRGSAKSSPSDDNGRRPKRLRLTTDRDPWKNHVRDATALTRELAARKLDARGTAIAKDRRRVWAGREPELADVAHGPPGLIAREERTLRAFTTGETVRFDELEAGTRRVVWDPRRKVHAFVAPVKVEPHTEQRGGVPPLQARWHFARARNKRELFDRVEACGKAETHKITVVCRDCKTSQEIQVGCGSQWFCPACRKRSMSRLRKSFIRNRLGLIAIATRAGLTRRKQKRQDRFGERFLTLTLPHHGDAVERIEVLNATWTRFWRVLRDELRPKLQGLSGIRGEHLPNGMPARKADAMHQVKRSYRAAATHREDAPRLDRFDAIPTGDFELSRFDVLSYFRVIEWTPGEDGKGHPHVHVWLFSPFLPQEWLERLWRDAWVHVQRERLHNAEPEPRHGPIEERRTIVHITAAQDGVEAELVKYLTKDWDVDGDGKARRVDPEIFAQVYAYLDGKRRRQSSAGFSSWGVAKHKACECCGFEDERGSWCRVDITHALEAPQEWLGWYVPGGRFLFYDPDDPDNPKNGHYFPMSAVQSAGAKVRAAKEAELDAAWIDDAERRVVASRLAGELGVSVAWMMTPAELRPPLEFEKVRFLCEGEPTERYIDPDQLEFEL